MRLIALTITAATALAAAASSAAAPTTLMPLKGSVGPGYTITLTAKGKKVESLRAGTYRFVIADRATIHNFVLEKERGGRFEKELTDVSGTGTKTILIKLSRGTWKFYCEPHESTMFGRFTVK